MSKEIRKFPLTDFVSSRKEPKRIPLKCSETNKEKTLDEDLDHENFETNNQEGIYKLES